MAGNKNLGSAKTGKKDEFYTQLVDIELELKHYRKHFVGKTVFCNCDDPYESNFFKYFAMNFNYLGLKKLIATCYNGSPVVGEQFEQLSLFDILPSDENMPNKYPYKIEITEVTDINGDGAVDLTDVEYLLRNNKNSLCLLNGNGDFRSYECIEILKESDIVVTNPPFSLFREYIAQLIEYEKDFIVVGNQNAITYKEIFPLIKDNKIWLGNGFKGNVGFFKSPYKDVAVSSHHKEGLIRVSGVMWFTNLDHKKRHEDLELYKKYTPEEYPKYNNYNAINVDKTADIPEDYYDVMGVPITFLDKYNPDQFEIIELSRYLKDGQGMSKEFVDTYYAQGNTGQISEGHPDLCYYDKKGKAVVPYMRILIRRRSNGN